MRNNIQSWKRIIALVLVICMSMSLNQNVNAAQVKETSDSTSNIQGEDLSGTKTEDFATTEEAGLLLMDVKDTLGNSLMDFDNTKTKYEILVNYDVDKVIIEAEASEESVVIDEMQIGEKTLEVGENEFIIRLNDKDTEYKITITRESAESDTTSIDAEEEISETGELGNGIAIQPFAMTMADSKIVIETETNSSQSQVTVIVNGLYPDDNVQNVRIPVWGNTGGQNDIKWYLAEKIGSGIWKATIDIASHKETGWYSVHVYAQINGEASKLVAGTSTSFYIDPISAQNVQIVDLDEAAGTFTVKISGNAAPASITQMRVPVWSAVNGQDDIIWYTAKESGGSWYVTVDAMRHNYDLGKYNIHVYAYDSRGISNIVGTSFAELNHVAKEKLDISLNADETKATITLRNAKYNSSTSVSFPVWGNVNGQNDLKWYVAKQISLGTWQAVVNISDHKESGLYSVHAYTASNGKMQSLVAHNSFNITEIKAGSIAVVEQDNAAGTFKIKIAGITTPASVTEVLVPVWSEINGQDDLIWYKATKSGDAWYASVNIADHNYDLGRYAIHVYVQDNRGIKKLVGATNATITEAKAESLSYVVNSSQTQVTITLDNVRERNLKSVQFAVWGEEGGQNDLKWYTATKSKSGCYTYTMNISTHKESGKYNIHAYKVTNSGSRSISRAAQFTIDKIGNATVEVLDNNGSGSFRVKISNISTPANITQVTVPVWSAANGQDDLIWYEATKSGDAWYISVDSMNHKFNTGAYNIHVYATDSRGIKNIVAGTTATVKQTVEEVLVVQRNSTQTQVTIALKNVRASDVKNVLFAVWGEKGGQNDLRWYTATYVGNGNYTLTINISNHKEAGTYNVHAYKKNSAGTMKISRGAQFSISNIGAAKVEIVEKNEAYGTYKVKVSNISSPAAITQVSIPTWSSVNGQNDIKWYTAVKSGDAWYATIEAYNHGYAKGTYISHAYVTDARGIQALVGAASTNVNATIKRQGFVIESGKTYYYNNNYQRVTGWQRINGSKYYFNTSTAVMTTGWAYVDGYKYYFGSNGALVQDVRWVIGAQSSYQIKINRQQNCITVYARDTNGSYNVPVVSFITTTGRNNYTPLGTFKTNRLGTWWPMSGGVYAQYVTQITGNYLFHSVPYSQNGNKYSLKADYFSQLGNHASAGCVRMTVRDAKWIFDNIPNGTTVTIYDSSIVGPFDKPAAPTAVYRSGYGWYDPTDPGI